MLSGLRAKSCGSTVGINVGSIVSVTIAVGCGVDMTGGTSATTGVVVGLGVKGVPASAMADGETTSVAMGIDRLAHAPNPNSKPNQKIIESLIVFGNAKTID